MLEINLFLFLSFFHSDINFMFRVVANSYSYLFLINMVHFSDALLSELSSLLAILDLIAFSVICFIFIWREEGKNIS